MILSHSSPSYQVKRIWGHTQKLVTLSSRAIRVLWNQFQLKWLGSGLHLVCTIDNFFIILFSVFIWLCMQRTFWYPNGLILTNAQITLILYSWSIFLFHISLLKIVALAKSQNFFHKNNSCIVVSSLYHKEKVQNLGQC